MRRWNNSWVLLVAVLSFGSRVASAQDLHLVGGRYFDTASGRLEPNPGLVVRAGKLAAFGATPSESAPRLELDEEHCILPGFFDLHAHYNVNLFNKRRRDETVVNPVLFLANGVTSTFPAGEYDPEDMEALARRIDAGEQVGPRLWRSGPYFGRVRPGWSRQIDRAQVHAEVDEWVRRGVQGFKAKGIGAEALGWLIERAHHHGKTVTGHLGSGHRGSVNPAEAIAMGIDRVEHFLGGAALPATRSAYASLAELTTSTEGFAEVLELYVANGVDFDATLTAYGYYGEREHFYESWTDESRFFTPFVRRHVAEHPPRQFIEQFQRIFEVKLRTVKAFHEAGGRITLGTDHFSTGEFLAGFAVHREMHALHHAGIPAAEVLRIATLHGARALGLSDRLGSIEPGKLADLVVLRGDPLEDIRATRQVERVVRGGVVHDAAALLASVEGRLGPNDWEEAREW